MFWKKNSILEQIRDGIEKTHLKNKTKKTLKKTGPGEFLGFKKKYI